MANYNFKRPESMSEDDPLWQYYSQTKASNKFDPTSEENIKNVNEARDSQLNKGIIDDLLATLPKAAAGFGTLGGVAPRTSFENYKPDQMPGIDAFLQDQEIKKQNLYGGLAQKLSERSLNKDKFQADQEKFNQSLELKKQEGDANRGLKENLFNQKAELKKNATPEVSPAVFRQQEKEQALLTPYGVANSTDDAKQLKAAHEAKSNFDGKIKEMIALREKHGGGALLNREDVARGRQLSKDLLLEYKNMAKLGVLSQSDEAIINAIIPTDPLAFTASGVVGQDPILSNLKKFQQDSERDFNTKVKTRTRDGLKSFSAPAATPSPDPETKVIGGVTYKKVPGGWAPLDNKMAGQ